MDKVYKPSATITIITAAIFFPVAIVLLFLPGKIVFAGFFIFLIPLIAVLAFINNYRSFILTNHSMVVKSWNGETKTEVMYEDIGKVYFHTQLPSQQQNQTTRARPVDEEFLSLWMKAGGSLRFDVTPIDESKELLLC